MNGMDGMEVLRASASWTQDCPTLLMTAYGTVEAAVEAMKLGAMDFFAKAVSPGSAAQSRTSFWSCAPPAE